MWKKVLLYAMWVSLSALGFSGAVLPAAAQGAVTVLAREVPAAKTLAVPAAEEQPNSGEPAGELPDSPGATLPQSQQAIGLQNSTVQPQSQPAQTQVQPSPQKPAGTAAAEAPNASGIAASQPAGVAIAPAKQHRARTIVLKVGAIVGAGVAVGAVVALTAATPSKPPGAH
jgi:hypothetical protein